MMILTIAKTTFGEALRKKVLNIFLLVGLALIAASVSFGFFSFRQEMTIVKSMGLGIISLAGMLVTLVVGINLIYSEIERRTIFTILSKPVRRYEFLLGKFLGGLITITFNLVLMSAVFFLMATYKSHWQPQFALLKGVLMTFFQLLLLLSVCAVLSTCLTPVVNFFVTAAVYVIGSLSDFTLSMSEGPGKTMVAKLFYKGIHYLLPNFANYFVQNPLIHPEASEMPLRAEMLYYGENIVYALVYAAILLIIAIVVFERRDM